MLQLLRACLVDCLENLSEKQLRGSMFFGSDSVVFIEAFLEGHDPIDDMQVDRWSSITKSAQRPQARI